MIVVYGKKILKDPEYIIPGDIIICKRYKKKSLVTRIISDNFGE
jgi:hypothetical protein